MPWAVAGVAVAAGGAYLASENQADAAKDASQAASFQPYNVFSGANSATFNPNGQINIDAGGTAGALSSELTRQSFNNLTSTDPNAAFMMQGGLSDFQTANAALTNVQQNTPAAADQIAGSLSALASQQNSLGQQGIQAAFNAPSAANLTNQAQSLGTSFLNTAQPQSFNGLAAERLSALRTAALPSEERAVDSKMTNLFSRGRLGTTGGIEAMGELALQQNLADQNRVINSQDFAQSQLNADRSYVQGQQSLGTTLLGQAFNGVGMDQNVAANQGSLGANMFNQQAQTQAASLAATAAGDASRVSTAQLRMQGAESLYGFGSAIDQQNQNTGLTQLGASQTIDQQALALAQLGSSVGSAQSSANANAGALLNPSGGVGTVLQGFGTGVSNMTPEQTSNVNGFFSGIFGGGS